MFFPLFNKWGSKMLFGIIKKIFSSVLSLLIFLLIVGAVVKYQLYSPDKVVKYYDVTMKVFHEVKGKFFGSSSGSNPEFGLDQYNIVVSPLPRGQSKYLVVLINNVDNNTNIENVVSAVKVLDTPVIIGIKSISPDKLSTITSELGDYKVSYAIDVPDDKIGDYTDLKKYLDDAFVKYSSSITINTIIVNTLSDAVSRYAVLNNIQVIVLSDKFGMGKLKVGGEVTNQYYFKSLYYPDIQEEDAPIIKEKIKKMVSSMNGVMIVGFDSHLLSSETAEDKNSNDNSTLYTSKSRLVQEAIINPIVDLYYSSSYKFYDNSFDQYEVFLSNVIKVSGYFTKDNVIIRKDDYGTKIEIPMGVYPELVAIKVPNEIGLINTQKLASVGLYYMNNMKVESSKYYKQEVNDGVIIYPLEDLHNVKLVITFVTSGGED